MEIYMDSPENPVYPLSEPIITPCTKYFWMKGYTQMMGTVDTTMAEYLMTLSLIHISEPTRPY